MVMKYSVLLQSMLFYANAITVLQVPRRVLASHLAYLALVLGIRLPLLDRYAIAEMFKTRPIVSERCRLPLTTALLTPFRVSQTPTQGTRFIP
ncbi:MAG: hypothetical protein KF726_11410 [Anaerolineae bacterium]|nr:hypothetical protein [Anaerolineae bacterium]